MGRQPGWSNLGQAIENADVIEHYGDSQFPMQLRMFAGPVYGSAPGGGYGKSMMQLFMAMEGGGGMFDGLNMFALGIDTIPRRP